MGYYVPKLKNAGAWLDWRGKYPGGYNWRMSRPHSKVKAVVVHHTVTNPQGNAKKEVDYIKRIHVNNNGWGGIGYHFIITTETVKGVAKIAYVGDIKTIRAHAPNYKGAHGIPAKYGNTYTLGVALIGQLHKVDPLPEQLRSAHYLLNELLFEDKKLFTNLGGWEDMIPHYKLDSTACPGKWVNYKNKIIKGDSMSNEEKKIKELEEKLKKSNEEIKKINLEKNKIEDEKTEALEQTSRLEKDMGEYANTINDLTQELGTEEKRIDNLNKYIKKIEVKNEDLEKKLKKCKNKGSDHEGDSSSPIETLRNIWKWLNRVGE